MPTVAICDTEPIAIEGLRRLFESVDGLNVVAADNSIAASIEAVRDLDPSLLMIDKSFGMQPVIDLLGRLRESDCCTHAVVWSAAQSGIDALRLIQAGATGVIRKTAPLKTLLRCLH